MAQVRQICFLFPAVRWNVGFHECVPRTSTSAMLALSGPVLHSVLHTAPRAGCL